MKQLLFTVFIIGSFQSFGQTKWINHKSHSGSKATFQKGKQKDNKSNFGLPGNQHFTFIDTVKAVSATEIQLIYRQTYKCHSPFIKVEDLKPTDFERKVKTISNVEGLNKNSTKEEILRIGLTSASGLWFNNSLEEVVFIGFKKK